MKEVSKVDSYAVRISGLGEGNHEFSFELDRTFFSSFAQSEIDRGNVRAGIILEKKPGTMALHFELSGEVEVICDRCLEPFMTAVHSSEVIYLKEGEESEETEENIMIIGKDDHEVNVGQLLYEFTVLALPVRRIHRDDPSGRSGCNPEMMKKLNAHFTREPGQNGQTDPRWDALRGIIEKYE